jgi:pyroglutamyl-peptidase
MKLLLTGFEPFGGSKTNPSEQVIRRLAGERIGEFTVSSVLLPVDRFQGPEKMLGRLKALDPDAVLCLGEASGRATVAIERIAVNLVDFRIPDNAGNQVVDEAVLPGGPAAYFATLPVRESIQALLNAGIPAELSLSAGSYLCNQVFYHLLHYISGSGRQITAGFVHLPALPEQAAQQARPLPTMSFETSLAAVRTIIACLSQTMRMERAG